MLASNSEQDENAKKIDKALDGMKCPNHPDIPIVSSARNGKISFFYCGCDKMKNLMKAKLRSIGLDDIMN